MNESNPCDAALAELLTLCVEVGEFAIYYRNHLGQLHRVHGPAVIHTGGTTSWWLNGKRHRDHGPAVIWADGSKSWYQDGHLHRTDGPAVDFTDGTKFWWLNGKRVTQEQHAKLTAPVEETTMAQLEAALGKKIKIIK